MTKLRLLPWLLGSWGSCSKTTPVSQPHVGGPRGRPVNRPVPGLLTAANLLNRRWPARHRQAVGNLKTVTYPSSPPSITSQYDALNRLTQRVDGLGTTVYTHLMLGNGQKTVTANGPWASDKVTVTNHHGRRAGLRIGEPGGGGFGDAARLRLRRNDTRYDGLPLVQDRDGGNVPLVTYTRGRDLSGSYAGAGGIGGLLARSHGYSGGTWSSHNFYHADGNGNVTALVNSSGTLQASYKYDPFGRYLAGGGSLASANGLRFSSKPWVGFAGSTTSGLYSYGYRFYDPYLHRWPNRDPLGERGGYNLYALTDNNPINAIDPLGLYTANVKNCEVVVLYGHGSASTPHKFKFGGSCSAGHFVGCESRPTNDKIPPEHRIPDAPSTDDELYSGPGNRDNPDQSFDKFMDDSWEAAKKKAKEICASKDNCCKSVTVRTELAGSAWHLENLTQPGTRKETIKCDAK